MTIGNNTFRRAISGRRTTYASNGGVVSDGNYGTLIFTEGKSWNGGDNPMYQKLIDRGLNATNGYLVKRAKLLYSVPATANREWVTSSLGFKRAVIRTYGSETVVPGWSASIVSDLTNKAMEKLYDKLSKEENSLSGFEFLGEFRETLHSIKHPAEALAKYCNQQASQRLDKFNGTKPKGPKKSRRPKLRGINDNRPRPQNQTLANTAAASWLELKFGAEPLVKTLQAAADAAVRTFPKEGAVKILRAVETQKVGSTSYVPSTSWGTTGAYHQRIENLYEYTVELKARVKYDGRYDGMSQLEQLKAQSGLTFAQVLPVAWELTPLSVFMDYFVNVSGILNAAVTNTSNVLSVDRYVTRKLIRRSYINWLQSSWPTLYDVKTEGIQTIYFKEYERAKWEMSIPTISFTTPAESITQMSNLAAFLKLAFF